MQVRVFGAQVIRYGTYSENNDRDPIKWRDGQLVEYVDVLVDAGVEGSVSRRLTLDQSVNGGRVEPGGKADLDCLVLQKSQVVFRRDGSERIMNTDKWKVFDMAEVAAPAKG